MGIGKYGVAFGGEFLSTLSLPPSLPPSLPRSLPRSLSPEVTKNRTITQFLQLCVYPRCRFTSSDALFSAKFVKMLHSLQAPNFSTLLFFDRVCALPACLVFVEITNNLQAPPQLYFDRVVHASVFRDY